MNTTMGHTLIEFQDFVRNTECYVDPQVVAEGVDDPATHALGRCLMEGQLIECYLECSTSEERVAMDAWVEPRFSAMVSALAKDLNSQALQLTPHPTWHMWVNYAMGKSMYLRMIVKDSDGSSSTSYNLMIHGSRHFDALIPSDSLV